MTCILLREALTLGRINKGIKCSVSGCSSEAARSLAAEKVKSAGLNIGSERHAYLCKKHYKEFKKRTKKDKQLEKWRYNA